ncbi:hypothetical protein RMATCC62417_12907 [Rhizopus microsporus]|nr:hypothetical protein RMATCC62417_12907 [Rhizopus microsporus]
METDNTSFMACVSSNTRISTSVKPQTSTMEIYSDEVHGRGARSSGRSSEEIFKFRHNRVFPVSVKELPIETLYCERTKQTQADTGLHELEPVQLMQSLQNGECTSLTEVARQERLHVQNRFERCTCSSADTRELQGLFDLFTLRHGTRMQESSIWSQCGVSGFLQAHEIRPGTITQVRNQICLLPRQHMCASEDEGRNARTRIQDDSPFRAIEFFDQQREEHPGTSTGTVVP